MPNPKNDNTRYEKELGKIVKKRTTNNNPKSKNPFKSYKKGGIIQHD